MGNLEAMVTIQHPEGFAKPQTGFRSKRLIKQAINSFCCTQLLENKGCQEKKKQQQQQKRQESVIKTHFKNSGEISIKIAIENEESQEK